MVADLHNSRAANPINDRVALCTQLPRRSPDKASAMGDHDKLFKRVFRVPRHAAGLIRTMLPAALVARMDLSRLELVRASFVDPELRERHGDLVFRVPIDGKMAFIYFLVEHQSEPDALMAFRLLTYIQRLWAAILRDEPTRKTLPLVVPIVVHHGRGGWTKARTLHELVDGLDEMPELRAFVPNFEMIIDDLIRVDDRALLARPLEAFPKVALWVLRDARTIDALFEGLRAWHDEIQTLVASSRDLEDFESVMRYILRVSKDVSFETIRDKFIEVIPEVEAAMASPAEQLIQKGRQEGVQQGLKKGRQEGRQEANRTMLARQLQLRFGALGPEAEARIAQGSSVELEGWLERVITADTLDAVFAG
ncbi:MAG: hypothetical protein DRJ42_06460 [Deltaproteobacteria bacterium]|nr:MAG: hypothetical protein DRJ42_06460 [Deltaproteobacteria bacterium]